MPIDFILWVIFLVALGAILLKRKKSRASSIATIPAQEETSEDVLLAAGGRRTVMQDGGIAYIFPPVDGQPPRVVLVNAKAADLSMKDSV